MADEQRYVVKISAIFPIFANLVIFIQNINKLNIS